MDEILASIRRIISEDAPVSEPAPPPPAAETAPEAPPVVPAPQPDPPMSRDPEPATIPEVSVTAGPEPADEPLVGKDTAAATASAFEALAATAGEASARSPAIALPEAGRTLEDLTADLLRPLLKTWLDENLAEIVRDRVDEEIRRIARGRVR